MTLHYDESNKDYHPQNAIDGNPDTYFDLYVDNLNLISNGSWKSVFSVQQAQVIKVEITSRKDCCWDEANNAKVYVGTNHIGTLPLNVE